MPAYIELWKGSVEASDVINGDIAAVRGPSSDDYFSSVLDSTGTTCSTVN